MSIANLSTVLKIFGGSEPSAEEQEHVFKEALLMTLARASRSDTNVSPVEVDSVRRIVQRVTGEEVSAADVHVAARSELYETASLDHYLGHVTRALRSDQRSAIVHGLAEVIKSDTRVSSHEVGFFNAVVYALKATPAEIAGLTEET